MSSTITCGVCGELGDANHRFCASCGAKRPEAAPPVPVPTEPPAPVAPAPVASAPVADVAPDPATRLAPPPVTPPPPAPKAAVDPAAFDAKGFLRSLYDFGFTSLIATKVIRFVYALLVISYSLGAALMLLVCLGSGKGAAIVFGLIFIPIVYLIYLIMLRIFMELIVVFFKMGEDVRAIRYSSTGTVSADWGSVPPPATN
jgi:hypothetical protein